MGSRQLQGGGRREPGPRPGGGGARPGPRDLTPKSQGCRTLQEEITLLVGCRAGSGRGIGRAARPS
jgi:hypothetical protein